MNAHTPHPFSKFVAILGRGKTKQRHLTLEESQEAMSMLLRGEAVPEQIGAFLMLLRVKEETGEELAGFVDACRIEGGRILPGGRVVDHDHVFGLTEDLPGPVRTQVLAGLDVQ